MAKQVWVVDDSISVANSIVALLTVEKIPAIPLYGGDEALNRLTTGENPSLIVLDLHMVHGTGQELLTKILANPRWTFPIIVLSSYADDVPRNLQTRVYRFLSKTIDPQELLDTIRRVI